MARESSYSYITYKWNSVFTLLVRHRQNELSWFAYICQVIYNGQLKLLLIYLPIVSNPCWGPRNKLKDDYRPLSGNLIFLNWFIGKEDQTLVWKCILFNLNIGDRTTSVLVYLFVYTLHSKTTIWKQNFCQFANQSGHMHKLTNVNIMFYIELLNRLVLVLGHFLPILRLTLLFVSECVYVCMKTKMSCALDAKHAQ